MKRPFLKFLIIATAVLILLLFSSFALSQEEPTSSVWSLWLGSHYTGYEDFYKKVGEFDRGEEEAMPEVSLSYSGYKGEQSWDLFGHYYDPKRISFDVSGKSKDVLSGTVSYHSFYRQRQTDLLENLIAREAKDQENNPGGKMFTYEHEVPIAEADFGYTRHEVKSDFQVKVPGSAKLILKAFHRSILEKGDDQKVVSMHCSSCHMVSKAADVDRRTHTVSAGAKANAGPVLFSYMGSYRTFKSEAPSPRAHYDSAQHPVSGDPMDFPERVIFQDTLVTFGQISDNEKMAHTLKVKTEMGKSEILGSFTHSQTKNKSSGIEVNGNGGTLKYVLSPSVKARFIAQASLTRIENDEVQVDLPAWRGGDPDQFDYVRYSSLTRTVAKGSARFIYQPNRKYRIFISAGYEGTERDDYPYFEAKEKTTKLKASVGGKYRPNSKFSGQFSYSLENTKDPAPYNQLFEASGDTSASPFYYFEREDRRYGDVTNQPTNKHGIDLTLNFRPDRKTSLSAGLKASLETNGDNHKLDYERTRLQPQVSLILTPAPRWNFFGNASYLHDKSNGLATVAMMDG